MLPTYDDYTREAEAAGTYENQILYRMCAEHPKHDDPYFIQGKLIAIGRIYAASIQRGAGKAKLEGPSLLEHVSECFSGSELDCFVAKLPHDRRIDDESVFLNAIECHQCLVDLIKRSIESWKSCERSEKWRVWAHTSFASKYLHFHRPNTFPIMDSIARNGLAFQGLRTPFGNYRAFCSKFLEFSKDEEANWTPRSIDTKLLEIGRGKS